MLVSDLPRRGMISRCRHQRAAIITHLILINRPYQMLCRHAGIVYACLYKLAKLAVGSPSLSLLDRPLSRHLLTPRISVDFDSPDYLPGEIACRRRIWSRNIETVLKFYDDCRNYQRCAMLLSELLLLYKSTAATTWLLDGISISCWPLLQHRLLCDSAEVAIRLPEIDSVKNFFLFDLNPAAPSVKESLMTFILRFES